MPRGCHWLAEEVAVVAVSGLVAWSVGLFGEARSEWIWRSAPATDHGGARGGSRGWQWFLRSVAGQFGTAIKRRLPSMTLIRGFFVFPIRN
jgi:hypothetical protein